MKPRANNPRRGIPLALRLRFAAVMLVLSVGFAGVAAKLFLLQVSPDERLARLQRAQLNKLEAVKPERGDIYDRNLEELAVTQEVDSAYINPLRLKPTDEQWAALAALLGKSESELRALAQKKKHFAWLKRRLAEGEAEKLAAIGIPGLGFRKEPKRSYPHGNLAAAVLGFADAENNGVYGVERLYESRLRGKDTRIALERDAIGRTLFGESERVKRDLRGGDLVLTIDRHLQFLAEKALTSAVEAHGARSGFIVAMVPDSGEILALATVPTFNPNQYGDYPRDAWKNRAFTDPFEPGSTFKVFTIAAALEEGLATADDLVYCENGKLPLADTVIHDTQDYRWLKVSEVLVHSSNIGTLKIGKRLGNASLYRWIKAFGFGSPTGLKFPGESQGLIKEVTTWDPHLAATTTFGQGILVTGVQLISAFSALANGGFKVDPQFLLPKDKAPLQERKRLVSSATAETIKEILEQVVTKGTGRNAAIAGYRAGGKTGTSQKFDQINKRYSKEKYVASFIGFAPVEHPRLSVLVAIDEPSASYLGGMVAAPVFASFTGEALRYLGVQPDDARRIEVASSKPRAESAATETSVASEPAAAVRNVLPDLRGKTLREVVRLLPDLEITVQGHGFVVKQEPGKGAQLSSVKRLTLVLSPGKGGGDVI